MNFVKLAKEIATHKYLDSVEELTEKIKCIPEEIKPYWMYNAKKDPTESYLNWGPKVPLDSGDAASRNSTYNRGLNITFGGV